MSRKTTIQRYPWIVIEEMVKCNSGTNSKRKSASLNNALLWNLIWHKVLGEGKGMLGKMPPLTGNGLWGLGLKKTVLHTP